VRFDVAPASDNPSSGPRPAASVAFVRDTERGIELYFSRRPMHFRYFPGAFVFPGGRYESSDADLKQTACREVQEEIGVDITPERLSLLRETFTAAHAGPVYHLFIYACAVDGEMPTSLNADEVDDELWLSPPDALARLDLPYQIMVAVKTISRYSTVAQLMQALEGGSFDEDYLV
jgi:8-oxo-dGTP pyrophosphatase MutT (NUDIX family)